MNLTVLSIYGASVLVAVALMFIYNRLHEPMPLTSSVVAYWLCIIPFINVFTIIMNIRGIAKAIKDVS